MLDRNVSYSLSFSLWFFADSPQPRKEKILQKHEFSGNKPLTQGEKGGDKGEGEAENIDTAPGPSRGRGGRGRGSGRGRGGRGGGDGGDNTARDRAWKDKNKARHGNHDRKRGHDKKMARAG
jgi:activating signal cointegrator complex subunit 2